MALGAIALLEINYRLSTQPEAGGRMTLFRIDMDVGTPWPWVAAVVCVVAGFVGLRLSLPRVRAAWERARVEAKRKRDR